MKAKIFLKGLTVVFLSLFILGPSFAVAADADILKRLEQMEREIGKLKKENAELRNATMTENSRLKQMVESDRQEITELPAPGTVGSDSLHA